VTTERIGGIVLCGGQSRRMGTSKADLIVDGDSLLNRTVRTVLTVADPVLVAAGPHQNVPDIPGPVRIVRDSQPHRGPLSAFAEALVELPPEVEWTFLVGCDMPFLSATYLEYLADRPRTADAIVPYVEDRWHPLAGIYRRSVQTVAERLLHEGRPRMLDLLESTSVTPLTAEELSKIDPDCRCLWNVNTPEELADALREPR
jgi:molybdopterin-guanine dinucleotide biosynthesis protein A